MVRGNAPTRFRHLPGETVAAYHKTAREGIMGTIHTSVGLAVDSANTQARALSRERPKENIMAIVSKDGQGKVFLAWPSVEQILAPNDTMAGLWRNGVKIKV
jgi:hypothetical protein